MEKVYIKASEALIPWWSQKLQIEEYVTTFEAIMKCIVWYIGRQCQQGCKLVSIEGFVPLNWHHWFLKIKKLITDRHAETSTTDTEVLVSSVGFISLQGQRWSRSTMREKEAGEREAESDWRWLICTTSTTQFFWLKMACINSRFEHWYWSFAGRREYWRNRWFSSAPVSVIGGIGFPYTLKCQRSDISVFKLNLHLSVSS